MMLSNSPKDRVSFIKFHLVAHLILATLLFTSTAPEWVKIGYLIYAVLFTTMLLMAHSQMKRVESKARHEIYWLMCMGGRKFAGEKRVESLNELEKAEAALEERKSFENVKKLQHTKTWHEEIVMKAYHDAIEMLDKVEEDQTRVLGKVE
jgi:hypothetical protein